MTNNYQILREVGSNQELDIWNKRKSLIQELLLMRDTWEPIQGYTQVDIIDICIALAVKYG